MAAINDLIAQVENPELRARLEQEVARLNRQKKFGLVFEDHMPECTPLYDVPIRCGKHVALRAQKDIQKVYTVLSISGDKALCYCEADKEQAEYNLADLVAVAQFGEAIYPYLKPLGSVCNAPDSNLWHTLIEADNYHALQLLCYLYAGKVDCIYIDPPYNTGAKDWKYNNDYVDGNDSYRHSKWLSMMQKRLKLAKRLLNPQDSMLIVAIDEKEYLHLGCILEEMFPEATISMITDVINPRAGVSRLHSFTRSHEFLYFLQFGESTVVPDLIENEDNNSPIWFSLMRTGSNSSRTDRPNLFYPVWVYQTGKLHSIGQNISKDTDKDAVMPPEEGLIGIWPLRPDGRENTWQLGRDSLQKAFEEGSARINARNGKYTINYLRNAEKERIQRGEIIIKGRDENGALILEHNSAGMKTKTPDSVWMKPTHDAGIYGSTLLANIFGERRFSFPKSLYAEVDAIRYCVGNKPNALIIDFFAGSGTTLHAVNLLNAEDGGNRRCIMVTNNEVSAEEAKSLERQGYQPGDEEWNNLGIARYVTWPRTVCTIEGHDLKGKALKGNYTGSEIPMATGFKSNAVFFKLGFLDKTSIALGRQFSELLPVLWMKSGANGPCPSIDDKETEPMLFFTENHFAVLQDETMFSSFDQQLVLYPEIETVFIVTDYEAGFRAMSDVLAEKKCYQLYRDYLDNFRINQGRA